jgi:NAD(P)-dependent dehydrogenase (short-subunit alcohol dehydrogenase family)
MTSDHVLIIGGSSGMGLALAERLLADGARVTIASRSADRLAAAAARLGPSARLRTATADIAREDGVRQLLADAAPLAHIAVTAADATRATGPLPEFDTGDARAVVEAKLFGAWWVAKHAPAHLAAGASITYTSGIAAHRPSRDTSMTAAVNGAIEALVRELAVELAPIRVNAVSPGWTDTPLWNIVAGDQWAQRREAMAARLPVGRIGRPEDIAEAFLGLMRNAFITGIVLPVDGGQQLS